jgi:flagellar biosynthesis/type III secretory pathway protein FliH
MANLSSLLDFREDGPSTPDWIARLQDDAGFVANAFDAARYGAPSTHEPTIDPIARAYQDGLAAGRAALDAEEAAKAEARTKFQLVLEGFNAEASAELNAALVETVISLCSQVMEPALIDREALVERCQTAIRQLGQAPARLKLYLHPEDRSLIADELESGPRLVEDAKLARGTLRLEGPDSVVADGPEDWRNALRGALIP